MAYALEHNYTTVTHERSQLNARARVLIPDICQAMVTSTADTFQVLRQAGAQLDVCTSASI